MEARSLAFTLLDFLLCLCVFGLCHVDFDLISVNLILILFQLWYADIGLYVLLNSPENQEV